MNFSALDLISALLQFAIVLFSLSVHESAHAWTADRLGDHTGRMLGRISLNPWPHIDLIGTILLPLVLAFTGVPVFGWAKPVPVISRNFRHIKRDMAFVGAAGPLSNLILAVAVTFILGISMILMGPKVFDSVFHLQNVFQMRPESPLDWVGMVGIINLLLASFNLIPIPPLDGSWILSALLPAFAQSFFDGLRRIGPIILLVLFFSRLINIILFPVYYLLITLIMGIPLHLLEKMLLLVG